ncbi:phosphoribosyl-ATP diphosphatase [Algiphilus sp. W345]|uniref:Phosphoribosyl-ATP pyrophosphatase n=1 Tax=Banduia mediterranea TaxID=3075609 RepID=A0ABU2WJM3_9GAMM|nr:phosphoribosyl-ATP diphosphatase [Algiphilus sp. W345]MDT0497819.1 phosphoribosyl-ATP diphosphatase [Algiphilus sp. W345]
MSETPENVLQRLFETLESRKQADPSSSYVARLYDGGIDLILKKLGEEAAETLIAAKNPDRAALTYELADLWFHSLVLAAQTGISLNDITKELARRMGRSGLDEKAARGGQ